MKVVGYWRVAKGPHGLHLAVYQKPNWLQRKLVKWLLTIEWIDA